MILRPSASSKELSPCQFDNVLENFWSNLKQHLVQLISRFCEKCGLGLFGSQFLNGIGENWIKLGTMFCLSFIMIHVGYEFEIDKSNAKQYAWDYIVAGTAAAFPWLFCGVYFV